MPDSPTTAQLGLLCSAIGVLVLGGIASILRLRAEASDTTGRRTETFRILAKAALYCGILDGIALAIWRGWGKPDFQPLRDNFSAFLTLAILLMLVVAYAQRARPLRGLDLFVMPIVLLLLMMAAIFGKAAPHAYHETTWYVVHRVTAYGGFVAFAVAGAVGVMYLLANYRLRRKRLAPGQQFGSLERLEHISYVSVTLGFALLTVGLVTGFFIVIHQKTGAGLGNDWYRNPKVVMACVTWAVYAVVMHSPINPALRGRRTAILSVVGFVLLLGTLVAVQFS